jgi:RNA polymerase sigma-70 factor (ECF subfamily)
MQDFATQWAAWMREADAGDAKAYRHLLEAMTPFIREVIRRALRAAGPAPADIEDITQETLLAIHLKRQTWDNERPIIPWIRAIARNKAMDYLRRRGHRNFVPIEDVAGMLPAPYDERAILERDAERLLSALGGRQRAVVSAIAIEGLSIDAVAARERMSNVAVRVTLHRGLKALAVLFRKERNEDK